MHTELFGRTTRFLCLFDSRMHKQDDACPYLFLVLDNNYQLQHFSLDEVQPAGNDLSKYVSHLLFIHILMFHRLLTFDCN